jgi:molybdate/tungstate transport system substrate-binding protein
MAIAAAVGVRTASTSRLDICHAGSVNAALAEVEQSFAAQHPEVVLSDVSGGSVALARRLATGQQACDVYVSADYLDIDRMLKPVGLASYTVVFAQGRIVLAYLATDAKADGVAAAGEFYPPAVPDAAPQWYQKLLEPGVRIGGAHPFLDPGGYRSHMIFELAQRHYGVTSLYNALLEHYEVIPASTIPGEPSPTLGRDYNFQFIYEHSAAAAAHNNPAYRYVRLPDQIDLSNAAHAALYAEASVTLPGLGAPRAAPTVSIPASRVAWGLTMLNNSSHGDNALAFVGLLLGPIGTAALTAHGPAPISPAFVTPGDYKRIPSALRPVVSSRSGSAINASF